MSVGIASVVENKSTKELSSSSSSSSSSASTGSHTPLGAIIGKCDDPSPKQRALILTSATLPDEPVVFVSKGFLSLTGYKLSDVLGKNLRILQGPGTDPRRFEMIGNDIHKGSVTSARLLNFMKGKLSFYSKLTIAPLKDKKQRIINYVGVMYEVRDIFYRLG